MALTDMVLMPGADYQDACDAIREKAGTKDPIKSGEMGQLIRGIRIEQAMEKDVNFFDYDGTLLYSYTLEEAQALTELPPAPTPKRDFLIFSRWLWPLDDIKTYAAPIDIGAIYSTVDNAVYVDILTILPDEEITLNVADNPTVDWGDGTIEESVGFGTPHAYAEPGDYLLKITGGGQLGGGTSDTRLISGSTGSRAVIGIYCNGARSLASYCFSGMNGLEEVSFSFTSPTYLLQGCRRLRHCNVPDNISVGMFRDCISLRRICTHKNTTAQSGALRECAALEKFPFSPFRITADGYTLYNCKAAEEINLSGGCGIMAAYTCISAKKIIVHEGVTSIGQQAFYNCLSAVLIDLPSTVTSIGAQAFQNCGSAMIFRFKSASPPTVENANAFTAISTSCIVEVPADSLAAYQAAENYGGIAAQMVGV